MDEPAEVSGALTEEIPARGIYLQALIHIAGGDLKILIGVGVNVIEGIVMLGKAVRDLVVDAVLVLELLLLLPAADLLVDVYNSEDKILVAAAGTSYEPYGMVHGLAVDHKAVLYALHSTLFHLSKEALLGHISHKDMLVLLTDDPVGVPYKVGKEVLAALLYAQRMVIGVLRIPDVLIGDGVDIVHACIIYKQSFGYLIEYFLTAVHRHSSDRVN